MVDYKLRRLESRGVKFVVREGTSDEKTFKEVIENKAYEKRDFQILPGETWLDLGGNVGAFTCLAASKGASVTCYEPDPTNCQQIMQNLRENKLSAKVVQAAVTHRPSGSIVLNVWPSGQSWRNSVVRNKKGTVPLEVPALHLFSLISNNHCIKMDIEGAEIAILEAWPTQLRPKKLVFEYSFDVDTSTQRLRRIIERMHASFTHVKFTKQIEKLEQWTFFPPCTMVHCWN